MCSIADNHIIGLMEALDSYNKTLEALYLGVCEAIKKTNDQSLKLNQTSILRLAMRGWWPSPAV